ncbi:methionyl-tRNA formyltransferase [Candidatus Marinamargulisbacteria bacterium SCGC AG-414-C22]|nr:methionyl-tRNA formyltransferase [Candidatus Marinamargulisbacteria bacterium SCGC AG-414-C22]
MKKKVIFCGTPDFANPSLISLLQNPLIEIIHVITQPDKIRSRGRQTSPTPVKKVATNHNIMVSTPPSKADFEALIKQCNPDVIIVIAYGMIIPANIVNHYTCINVHASCLPKYRGASPIQTALLNNDNTTGVSIIKMNDKMDEGPILLTKTCNIQPTDNFQTLHDTLATLGTDCLNTWLDAYLNNSPLSETTQNHNEATYCKKIQKEDLLLNPNDSIYMNHAKIKAFSPVPGAYMMLDNQRIKILAATIKDQKLIPTRVKPAGKQEMTYEDFKRGYNKTLLC